LFRYTVSSRLVVSDVLAGVDVDHGERLGAVDDQGATGRQVDFRSSALCSCSWTWNRSKTGKLLGLGVVVLPHGRRARVDRADVVPDLLELAPGVDDNALRYSRFSSSG